MKRPYYLLFVFFVAALLTLPWIGDKPFFTRGEPREAIVAQDMLRTGNWILPSGYGSDVPSKPPMLHWLIAGASKVSGGISEFASRIPSAIASIFFACGFFLFLRKRTIESEALIASLVLLTCSEWSRAALTSRVDLVLAASTAAGLLFLFEWSERGYRGVPIGAILTLTAATLVKGPVSIVLPGAIVCLYGLSRKDSILRLFMAGVTVFLPVALLSSLWYFAAYTQEGEQFYQMVMDENFRRFAGTMEDTPHKHSVVYHPLMLFVGLLPWTLIVVPFLIGARKQARNWWKSCSAIERYSALVAVVFLLFYSIPASKRAVYLLPAYPFLAVLLGRFFSRSEWERGQVTRWLFGILGAIYLGFLLLLVAPQGFIEVAFTGFPNRFDSFYYVSALRQGLAGAGIWDFIVLSLPIVALGAFYRSRESSQDCKAASIGVVISLLCAFNGPPTRWIGELLSSKPFSEVVAAQVPADAKLYSYKTAYYGIAYYTSRQIFHVPPTIESGAYVLVGIEDIPSFLTQLSSSQTFKEVTQSTNGITKLNNIVILGTISEKQ